MTINFEQVLGRLQVAQGQAVAALKARNGNDAQRAVARMTREVNALVEAVNDAANGVVEYRLVEHRHYRTDGKFVALGEDKVAAGE